MPSGHRKNILLLVSALNLGGAQRVAATLTDAWTKRGHQVTLVVTFSGHGESFYAIPEQVKVVFLADLVNCTKKSIFNQAHRLLALRRLIRITSPDVVISFLTNVNVAVICASCFLNIPVIACERTNPSLQQLSTSLTFLRRLTYPFAQAVTVQTESLAMELKIKWRGVRRLRVLPNPLPPGLFDTLTDTMGQNAPRLRLIAMGRLVTLKGFELLIELFSRLVDDFPEWDLWIYGEGPQKQGLLNLAATHGLTDRIFLPGSTRTPWTELTSAHAFVLTSKYEGFPNALLEAMALGLPCVSFDCPHGPREISCNGKYALLVPSDDEIGMEVALRRLMSSEALRRELGAQASDSVRKRYALEHVLTLWDELFAEVCR